MNLRQAWLRERGGTGATAMAEPFSRNKDGHSSVSGLTPRSPTRKRITEPIRRDGVLLAGRPMMVVWPFLAPAAAYVSDRTEVICYGERITQHFVEK